MKSPPSSPVKVTPRTQTRQQDNCSFASSHPDCSNLHRCFTNLTLLTHQPASHLLRVRALEAGWHGSMVQARDMPQTAVERHEDPACLVVRCCISGQKLVALAANEARLMDLMTWRAIWYKGQGFDGIEDVLRHEKNQKNRTLDSLKRDMPRCRHRRSLACSPRPSPRTTVCEHRSQASSVLFFVCTIRAHSARTACPAA